jgi:hypothetical protein
MRRMTTAMLLASGVWIAGALASPAAACPMCKAANAADQNGEPNTKPQAYMYSILFMLSMPATLLGAFGIAFWRIQRTASVTGRDNVEGSDMPAGFGANEYLEKSQAN